LNHTLRLLLRLVRPHFLLGAVLLYALGGGIAHYLGQTIDWGLYWTGQAWIILLQLSVHLLDEYFGTAAESENAGRPTEEPNDERLPRTRLMWGALACLAAVASLTVLMMRWPGLPVGVFLLLAPMFLGAFFYAVPPLRLVYSGYGELVMAIVIAGLVPALAFMLQAGELHRLLAMTSFPLVVLYLAMLINFELPGYATDLKYEKRTLLIRLGWQRGMILHNILVLVGFLLLALALLAGLALALGWPAFLPLPLGLFQIWQMNRIADGAKPNWSVLTLTAAATFGITAYLLAFAFWTR
jgi:1,4-dihydroxy-2-naphthoate octaprenyltransferase